MSKNSSYLFRAIIEPDKPHGWHGFVPALPGCHTFGDTVEEARKNLNDAICGMLSSMVAHKIPIPEDETLESLERVEIDYAKTACVKSQRAN